MITIILLKRRSTSDNNDTDEPLPVDFFDNDEPVGAPVTRNQIYGGLDDVAEVNDNAAALCTFRISQYIFFNFF